MDRGGRRTDPPGRPGPRVREEPGPGLPRRPGAGSAGPGPALRRVGRRRGGLAQALATGAWRVNLATTALQDPVAVGRLLAAEGPRIAVGVDVLGDRVVARGSGVDLGPLVGVLDLLVELLTPTTAGAVVLADAGRDGRRSGADVGLLARVVARLGTRVPVVSSGGIAELDDLRALRAAGASGAVLGAALYHGAFTLSQAKEAVA
ncbi:HisA/HisF-related TIM barrel protein [Ornithinimicrobium sp. W1665]|uniref:HisA/HisF-related TIM barrel protein n=1 Tax=Ornithinimicrobium sp. W1665 TaxID=3416666 RepID=UPI003D6A4718